MGDATSYQRAWRNRVRLKEIVRNWKRLPERERTTRTLLLATDGAHLDRDFVAENCLLDLEIQLAPRAVADGGEE